MKSFKIEISETEENKKRSKPQLMDMTIWRPRKSKKFSSPKDYTRKQKYKISYE